MTHFEHFYIKDQDANQNGWEDVHLLLTQIESKVDALDINKPDSFINRERYTYIFECASFLYKLFTQQAVRLGDALLRLTVLINASRSVLTLYEDDRIEDMTSERCQEIKTRLKETLEGILVLVNKQKFIMPVDQKKTAAASILEDDGKDPVLSVDDSYDNFTDAMRLMLRRMKEAGDQDIEKLLSPQERLFHNIREQLNKTISNFSTAAAKVKNGHSQFARGTIAVQGRIDRKGLKLIPEHHVVQMAGTEMCPGFSSRDSDIMTPTVFLHNQIFAIFNPAEIPVGLTHVSDSRRDKIARMRAYIMASPKRATYRDVLENALQHKLFPGLVFVWLIESEAAEKLDLRTTIKAELAF